MIYAADFEREMKKIADDQDKERRLKEGDKLLCDALESLGYTAGVKIYKEMNKKD